MLRLKGPIRYKNLSIILTEGTLTIWKWKYYICIYTKVKEQRWNNNLKHTSCNMSKRPRILWGSTVSCSLAYALTQRLRKRENARGVCVWSSWRRIGRASQWAARLPPSLTCPRFTDPATLSHRLDWSSSARPLHSETNNLFENSAVLISSIIQESQGLLLTLQPSSHFVISDSRLVFMISGSCKFIMTQ